MEIYESDVCAIASRYESLDLPRRLLVLGDAGSGKTVAANLLVLQLLERSPGSADAKRVERPFPVRVNAAGWDGTKAFSDWLATRLCYDYPHLRPKMAQKLIEDGWILPVIDGLDEMDTPESQASRGSALLNHLNGAWCNEPVVVVCRADEFTTLSLETTEKGLFGAAIVTLQSVTDKLISGHLTRKSRRATETTREIWSQVATRVTNEPDGPLATALNTPWMLGLAVTALRHDPGTADRLRSCTTADAVKDLLFAAQIPAAIHELELKNEYSEYTGDNIRAWMQSLARCLENRRNTGRDGTAIRLDEIWEIAGSSRCRILHGLTVAAIVMIPATIMFLFVNASGLTARFTTEIPIWIAAWFRGSGPSGVAGWVAGGLILALGIALMVAMDDESPPDPRYIKRRAPEESTWQNALVVGFVSGLMVVLWLGLTPVIGVMAGVDIGIAHVLVLESGLIVGLAGGLAAGFGLGTARQVEDETRLIRDESYDAIRFGGVAALTSGLAAGGISAVVLGLTSGDALTIGLVLGLMVALTIVPLVGRMAGRFFIATLVFRFTKAFPARPTVFLDWSRRSGLLRVNGTAYQFRHETYRQWLQRQPPPE